MSKPAKQTRGRKEVKKAKYSQIPPGSLWALAEHFGRGAEKYGDFNFLNGLPYSSNYNALMRHANQWWAGEEEDPEGGHHLIAVAWHALVLYEFLHSKPEFDDRRYKVELRSEVLHD